MWGKFWVLAVFLVLFSMPVLGHQSDVNYLSVDIQKNAVYVNFSSLTISTEELETDFSSYFLDKFSVSNEIEECVGQVVGTEDIPEVGAVKYMFVYDCGVPENLNFSYNLFFEKSPEHFVLSRFSLVDFPNEFEFRTDTRNYIVPISQIFQEWGYGWDGPQEPQQVSTDSKLNDLEGRIASLEERMNGLDQGEPSAVVSSAPKTPKKLVWKYFVLGIQHILTGYDHILFLLGLLLVAMYFKYLVQIVTSFTIAHSITLALSVLGIVVFPVKWVEVIIALSIVYIAFENLYIKFVHRRSDLKKIKGRAFFGNPKKRWILTFAFGLIHGLGFSTVLKAIGLPKDRLVISLFLFNVGVEVGQLAIVFIVFPIIWWSRHKRWHDTAVKVSSILIGVVGFAWLVQRIFF